MLRWIERVLIAVGVALGAWAAMTLLEGHYFGRLPAPVKVTVESAHSIPARGEWVARLEAPSVNLSATVLEGSDDHTLSLAAGHIEDTAFPGDPGNVGIAGHRDTTFIAVRDLKIGDPLLVTTGDRIFEYRISDARIVNPQDVYVLDPTDHPTLTLVTCYPFEFIGHAPQRYVVRAELVKQELRAEKGGAPTGQD